jgi:hypothetical protein
LILRNVNGKPKDIAKRWPNIVWTPPSGLCNPDNARRQTGLRSYQLHCGNLAMMVKADPSLGSRCSYSTVKRFMQTRGMVRKQRRPNRREWLRLHEVPEPAHA